MHTIPKLYVNQQWLEMSAPLLCAFKQQIADRNQTVELIWYAVFLKTCIQGDCNDKSTEAEVLQLN